MNFQLDIYPEHLDVLMANKPIFCVWDTLQAYEYTFLPFSSLQALLTKSQEANAQLNDQFNAKQTSSEIARPL